MFDIPGLDMVPFDGKKPVVKDKFYRRDVFLKELGRQKRIFLKQEQPSDHRDALWITETTETGVFDVRPRYNRKLLIGSEEKTIKGHGQAGVLDVLQKIEVAVKAGSLDEVLEMTATRKTNRKTDAKPETEPKSGGAAMAA